VINNRTAGFFKLGQDHLDASAEIGSIMIAKLATRGQNKVPDRRQ
jgi:hypothetical protein